MKKVQQKREVSEDLEAMLSWTQEKLWQQVLIGQTRRENEPGRLGAIEVWVQELGITWD